jgi:hypothetical protein
MCPAVVFCVHITLPLIAEVSRFVLIFESLFQQTPGVSKKPHLPDAQTCNLNLLACYPVKTLGVLTEVTDAPAGLRSSVSNVSKTPKTRPTGIRTRSIRKTRHRRIRLSVANPLTPIITTSCSNLTRIICQSSCPFVIIRGKNPTPIACRSTQNANARVRGAPQRLLSR